MTRILLTLAFGLIISCKNLDAHQPDIKDVKSFFAHFNDSVLERRRFFLVDTAHKIHGEWQDLFIHAATQDKTLSSDEIKFIAAQFEKAPIFVWTNTIFDSAIIVSHSYIDNFRKTKGVPLYYYQFSLPYFSKDRKYCILYCENYCGELCGEESLRLYKNNKGKWTLVTILYGIMS